MTDGEPRYPRKEFTVTDLPVLNRVIDELSLATLVSNGNAEIMVSHVPLIRRAADNPLGTLVGHLDRNNPHAHVLDGAPVVAVFRGPDSYISPTVYATRQLPTWNSIVVEVRGIARVTHASEEVRASLVRMAAHLERGPRPFVLADDDLRVGPLLAHIVGFEISIASIEGRFKLGQDNSGEDRANTNRQLLARTPPSEQALVADLLDLPD